MTKYLFIENGKINGGGEISRLDTEIKNIEVDDITFQNYIDEPNKFIYQNGKIVQNPNYEKQTKQLQINNEISQLKSQMDELDKKRIRAICENSIKDEQLNQTWLDYYNNEAKNLRTKINELTNALSE